MRRAHILVLLIVSLFGATGCPQEVDEGLPPAITLPDGKIYRVELGKSLTISPAFENLAAGDRINWLRNGAIVGTGASFTFTPDQTGVYYFTVEAINPYGRAFAEIRIDVAEPAPPEPPEPPTPPDTIPTPPVERLRCVFEQMEYHVSEGGYQCYQG